MKKDKEYMRIALKEAHIALQYGEFPVGCVIADDKKIWATGSRINSGGKNKRDCEGTNNSNPTNEFDHAEINALKALLSLSDSPLFSTLTVYSTMEPCLMCYGTLLVNGLHRIVYGYEDVMGGGTSLPLSTMPPLYRDMKVEVIPHILRNESLQLFKEFFSRPNCVYLQKSYLAQYTLKQP